MRRAQAIGLTVAATVLAAACGSSVADQDGSGGTAAARPAPSTSVETTTATTVPPTDPDVPTPTVPTTPAASTDGLEVGDSYVGPLTFSWPVDCSVPVTGGFARYDRDGEFLSGASFEMQLVLGTDARGLAIAPRDFAITAPDQVSGEPLATLERQLLPPTFVVDARGAVVEIRGLERSNALFDSNDESPLSATELQLLEQHYRTWVWGPWAGMWAAFGTIEPQDSIGSSELEGHPPGRFEFELWEPPRSAGGVVLTSAAVREPGLAHLFSHVDLDLASADAMSQIEAAQWPDLTDVGVSVSAQIDPASLQPGGLIVRRTFFTESGFGIQESRDDHWEFDWATSDCDP